MQRVFTYAEQIANYPWPKGREETRKYFETLGQDKIAAISVQFGKQEQKSLPLAELIAAALFLEDTLNRILKPASMGEMVAARKIEALDACSFYILPSIPVNLDDLRGCYLWILSPEHIRLYSALKVYDVTLILQALEQLFIGSNKNLCFISIDGKIELVPIREPKNFAITFLNIIYTDAVLLKGFTLEKLKDFHRLLSAAQIYALITENGGHTPIKSNAIHRTLAYFRKIKMHQDLRQIMTHIKREPLALTRIVQAVLGLQSKASKLEIELRLLLNEELKNQRKATKSLIELERERKQLSEKISNSISLFSGGVQRNLARVNGEIEALTRLDDFLKITLPEFFSKPFEESEEIDQRADLLRKVRAYLTAELSMEARGKLKKEIRDFLLGERYSLESVLEEREKVKAIQQAIVEKNLAAFIKAVETWEAKNFGLLGGVASITARIRKMMVENQLLFMQILKVPRARWSKMKDRVETWTEADINAIFSVLFPNDKDKLYRGEWRDFRRAASKQERLAKLIDPDLLIDEQRNPYKDFVKLFVVFNEKELALLSITVKNNLSSSIPGSSPAPASSATTLISSDTIVGSSCSSSSSSSSTETCLTSSSLYAKQEFTQSDDSDEEDDLDEEQALSFKAKFRKYAFTDTEAYLENLALVSKDETSKQAKTAATGVFQLKSPT